MNGMDDRNDLNLDGNLDVSLCLRMSDQLGDLNLGVNLLNRSYVRHDLMMDGNLDVSLCRNSYVTKSHRVDLSIDPPCYVSHVNRNCVRHDRNLVVTMVVKNHHVMLMVYLSMSCDRMSHDHLRYDHQMMRHRDKNRMDGMILDGMNLVGKLKNSGAMNSDARMI
jgi:hypothetical protein